MKMNSKQMTFAHKVAKMIAKLVGDYMVALKLALKYVWGMVRKGAKRWGQKTVERVALTLVAPKVEANIDGIPMWIIEKNLQQDEVSAIKCGGGYYVATKETEKAVGGYFSTDFGRIYMWCPKSVLVDGEKMAILFKG